MPKSLAAGTWCMPVQHCSQRRAVLSARGPHLMLMGNIMRTFMVLSLGRLPLGSLLGSKSGG